MKYLQEVLYRQNQVYNCLVYWRFLHDSVFADREHDTEHWSQCRDDVGSETFITRRILRIPDLTLEIPSITRGTFTLKFFLQQSQRFGL